MITVNFSEIDLNLLGEIGNISVGGAATSLSDFVDKLVTISVPDTKVQTFSEVAETFGDEYIFVKIDYTEGLEGANLLLIKKEEAMKLENIVLQDGLRKGFSSEINGYKEILMELFNIMVGNMTATMSEMFGRSIKIDPPLLEENSIEPLDFYALEERLVTIWFELRIENSFQMKLVKIINQTQAEQMINLLKEDHQL